MTTVEADEPAPPMHDDSATRPPLTDSKRVSMALLRLLRTKPGSEEELRAAWVLQSALWECKVTPTAASVLALVDEALDEGWDHHPERRH